MSFLFLHLSVKKKLIIISNKRYEAEDHLTVQSLKKFYGMCYPWVCSKHSATLYHCRDSPSPKPRAKLWNLICKWTLASFRTPFCNELGTTQHELFIHLTDIVARAEKEDRMNISTNIGKITIIPYMTGVMTLQKWIPGILKPILAIQQTWKPLLGPWRGKGKNKVSVLSNALLLKLRSKVVTVTWGNNGSWYKWLYINNY